MRQQLQTNPHGKFERVPTNATGPSGSPGHIIAIAAHSRRLPLMSHHRNRRAGRNGGLRAEPGASASARLTLRQASHGGRRNTLLAWERGAVAYMIHSNTASVPVRVCISFFSSSSSVLPTFVLTALHSFSLSGATLPPHHCSHFPLVQKKNNPRI